MQHPDSCIEGDEVLRSAAGKVLRNSDGQLVIRRKCIFTFLAVVSGFPGPGGCSGANGQYICIQRTAGGSPTSCDWNSLRAGGSGPGGGWDMRINYVNGPPGYWHLHVENGATDHASNHFDHPACQFGWYPKGFCGLGTWYLQGHTGIGFFCPCTDGHFASVTTEKYVP